MKKILYSITTILLAASALSLSSCLKDSRYVDFTGSTATVELPLAAYQQNLSPGSFVTDAFPIQSTPQTIPVVINIASPTTLKTATTVTLKLNTDTIASLNNIYQEQLTAYDNDTTGLVPPPTAPGVYELPPANAYSISSLTATIPAGQRTATINISVTTSNFDVSKYYLIPLTISNGGGVQISNYRTVVFNVQAKNKYDGEYTVTGTMKGSGAYAAYTVPSPLNYYLETQGANSDALFDFNYSGAFGHEILDATGATSYFGSFSPLFTFDANNNITSVTNYYGQHSGGHSRSAVLDKSGVNKFTSGTPGTKGAIFQVTYDMIQDDVSTTSPTAVYTETYTYVGARP